MEEQCDELSNKGISALHVTSTSVNESTEAALFEGRFRLIFISPEQLLGKKKWRDLLRSDVYQKNMVAFVVDEAHCVKKW